MPAGGISILARSPNLPSLEVLDLSENFIMQQDLRALVSAPYLKSLKELGLIGTDVGVSDLTDLARSSSLRSLQAIYVARCRDIVRDPTAIHAISLLPVQIKLEFKDFKSESYLFRLSRR